MNLTSIGLWNESVDNYLERREGSASKRNIIYPRFFAVSSFYFFPFFDASLCETQAFLFFPDYVNSLIFWGVSIILLPPPPRLFSALLDSSVTRVAGGGEKEAVVQILSIGSSCFLFLCSFFQLSGG